jgi:transposase
VTWLRLCRSRSAIVRLYPHPLHQRFHVPAADLAPLGPAGLATCASRRRGTADAVGPDVVSLKAEQFECRVLDPTSLQVNGRARRVKTDRIDVLILVRAPMAVDRGDRHVCSIVRVPSDMLIQLRGVGPASAAILAREIFGRHFANRRQVRSYLGLTPSAYDSGSTTCCRGASRKLATASRDAS